MVLSTREKVLIAAAVVAVLLGGLYFAARGVRAYETGLRQRIERQENVLRQARALRTELERLQGRAGGPTLNRPLIGYLERLAQRAQLGDRIQLNAVPQQVTAGLQGVEVKVDNLTLDELVDLLYIVENAEPKVVIDQMELSPAFREKDLLRLTMRVLAGGG